MVVTFLSMVRLMLHFSLRGFYEVARTPVQGEVEWHG